MNYVSGLLFSNDLSKVLLIRKLRPAYLCGLLTGPGGKVEPGESSYVAMVREFFEEVGYENYDWNHFLNLGGKNPENEYFSVDFFASRLDHNDMTIFSSQEEEQLEVVEVLNCHAFSDEFTDNIPWVVGMAIDHLRDGRPHYACVVYR